MSFDLYVTTDHRPANLAAQWEHALAEQGLHVEICPGFSPTSWGGGYLPFRLQSAPTSLLGVELNVSVLAGFELHFYQGGVCLMTGSGRSTADMALQCLGAATLAELTGGTYEDPQSGAQHNARAARDVAVKEILRFTAAATPAELILRPFPGWETVAGTA